MQFMLTLTFSAIISIANTAPSILPVNPGGIGGLFKGPNSETIIQGPDGSIITSAAEGGEVLTGIEPIVVADSIVETAPVTAPVLAPIIAPQVAPVQIVPEDVHIIETELVDAPDVEPDQAADLVGPSGTISTRGSKSIISGPASTTISEPVRKIPIVAAPVLVENSLLNAPSVGILGANLNPVAVGTSVVSAAPVLADVGHISATVAPSTINLNAAAPIPSIISAAPTVLTDGAHISATAAPILNSAINVAPQVLSSSSNGVLLNSVSSTIRPDLLNNVALSQENGLGLVNTVSSTVRPDLVLGQNVQISTPSSITANQQLQAIAANNQQVAEIQAAAKAKIAAQAVISVPSAPGLISSTVAPSIDGLVNQQQVLLNQGSLGAQQQVVLDNGGHVANLAGNHNQVLANQQVLLQANNGAGVPLLRETNPIIGTSQGDLAINVNLANVPLSEVSRIAGPLGQDISSQVYNRYGREVDKKAD